jgi:hypothetical protein
VDAKPWRDCFERLYRGSDRCFQRYSEEGGSFPSAFDAVNDHATVARLGIDFVHDLTDKVRLTARTEADYRFEKNMARTSGEILGISAFSLTGEQVRQVWFCGAVGTEFDVAGGTASLGVNVTTQGNDPDVWLRSGAMARRCLCGSDGSSESRPHLEAHEGQG